MNRFGSVISLMMCGTIVWAEDWPHWRGPYRNGISAETGWLDQWPAGGPVIAWKTEVGTGFSSFAVAGGRVFTMGHASGADTVFCLDADSGKLLWKHSYPSDLGDNLFEGGPCATPTLDGDRVFTLSRWGDVFCLDAASGKVHWSQNAQKETGAPIPQWGFAGSPAVLGNLLLLNVGEAGVALEKTTGKLLWHSAPKEAGYSTPLPAGDFVIFSSAQAYIAGDPRSGKELWRVRWVTQYGCNAADPILSGNRLFISTGYSKGATLLKLDGESPTEIWKSRVLRTQLNAGVLVGGHVYGMDGDTGHKGGLKCIELESGAEKWHQKDLGFGSVTVAGEKLIVLTDRGELLVAPVSPKGFQPTARAKVLTGRCWTVPVLAHGRLYCRNAAGHVVCVDLRRK